MRIYCELGFQMEHMLAIVEASGNFPSEKRKNKKEEASGNCKHYSGHACMKASGSPVAWV
jgi:hypothetical protein